MPSTNVKRRQSGQRGFTLVELMAAAVISLIVFAGLFSAYVFIARNITRNTLAHQQTLQNARVQRLFANDVSAATKVIIASNWKMQLQLPGSVVTYTYTSADQTLQRSDTAPGSPAVLLGGITPLGLGSATPSLTPNIFNYYNQSGVSLLPVTVYPPPNSTVILLIDVRQIELSFLSTGGVSENGTLVRTPAVSSRIILRNKPALGQ